MEFDDFTDLNFIQYKDVHIHAMEIYHNGEYLNGMEIYYIVDGDVMRYILHHRIKKQATGGALKSNALSFLTGKKPMTK